MNRNQAEPLFFGTALFVLLAAVLTWFGYFVPRSQFVILFLVFYGTFAIQAGIISFTPFSSHRWKWVLFATVGIRLLLLGMTPNMSDDFYRFIWDGVLLSNGINPFEHLPSYYMEQSGGNPGMMVEGLSSRLFNGMNSPGYYTIYPPLCQAVFWLAAELFSGNLLGNVIVMRFILILAETATIWFLIQLADIYNKDVRWVLLYALNPMVIMELTGNLHFEALMIAFLLGSFYFMLTKRYWFGFALLALSINTKLIPLVFMPYLAFSLGWKKTVQMSGTVGVITLILHLPFYDLSFIQNFFSSIELYFQKFEFNASIYYIVRWIGYQVKGYNIIESAGKHLAVYSTLLILLISLVLRDKKLRTFPTVVIFALSGYYFLAPVVHPWYITTLLAFVPLTGYLFPYAWSLMLPLTYHVYRTPAYNELLWIVAIEYMVVYVFFAVDIWQPAWYERWKSNVKAKILFT